MELVACPRATTAFLWLLTAAKAFSESLRCACTTHDCVRENATTCDDATWCYAQRMRHSPEGLPNILRGCIFSRTPLLCENKRPRGGGDNWPSLHCCQADMCNKEVIPTFPTYVDKHSKTTAKMDTNTDLRYYHRKENKLRIKESEYNPLSSDNKSNLKNKTDINPIYIGIPLAGACVLLAMIIFTIFILKRQRSYPDPPICQHNDLIRVASIEHRHIYRPATARDKVYVVKHPSDMKPTHYTNEYNRSSSESEATLLTKK